MPVSTSGLTVYHLESAATTNAVVVKNTPGVLLGWAIYNASASMRKVAFHNTASAPTAGASVFFTIALPAGALANVLHSVGIEFSAGIAITTVSTLPDSGAGAVAVDDLNINLFYA